MTTQTYDVVIVGAGSVGLPTAFFMADAGLKVLVVDQFASPGQGSNKAAIGGIRATHSDPAKIRLCLKSIEIFSTWEETYGDDIEWYQGGYCFVAYREQEERILKDLLKVQHSYGLNIRWLDRDDLLEVVPALNPEGLIGGTYSPGDGSASPLLTAHAFYKRGTGRRVSLPGTGHRHYPAAGAGRGRSHRQRRLCHRRCHQRGRALGPNRCPDGRAGRSRCPR